MRNHGSIGVESFLVEVHLVEFGQAKGKGQSNGGTVLVPQRHFLRQGAGCSILLPRLEP